MTIAFLWSIHRFNFSRFGLLYQEKYGNPAAWFNKIGIKKFGN
jgi:hypothetical protein